MVDFFQQLRGKSKHREDPTDSRKTIFSWWIKRREKKSYYAWTKYFMLGLWPQRNKKTKGTPCSLLSWEPDLLIGWGLTLHGLYTDIWKHDRDGNRRKFSWVFGLSAKRLARHHLLIFLWCFLEVSCVSSVWAWAIYSTAAGREQSITKATDPLAFVTKPMSHGPCRNSVVIHSQKKRISYNISWLLPP